MKFLVLIFALIAAASAGVLPLASYAIAPVASSYSAHTVNHAVAAPVFHAPAPVVAAPAPLVAAPAPLVAAPAPVVAAPVHLAAYSAYPYAPFAPYYG